RVELRCEPVDVGELARSVLAESELEASHPVTVVADGVVAVVDRVMVERIVSNLASNAQKHLATGVQVWIRGELVEGGLQPAVEDDGPETSRPLSKSSSSR